MTPSLPCPRCDDDEITVTGRDATCPSGCDVRVVDLKFVGSLITDIKEGRKRKTFRYDDEKDIQSGDILRILETRPKAMQPSPTFGYATVVTTDVLPIEELTPGHFAWHTTARGPETLADSLQTFYNDVITMQTPVKYIVFTYHDQS